MKTIKIIRLTLHPGDFSPADIPRLRAFLAKHFPQYKEIHNHLANGGYRYVYPELQFKILNKQPAIVGFATGFKILTEIFNRIGYIEINRRTIVLHEKSIMVTEERIGEQEEFLRYRFETPWMALNQRNYDKFLTANLYEREQKLNRILWGNIRALAHAFNYWIEDQEALKVNGHFKMYESKFKENIMLTFKGEFVTNFCIPNYLGLGKQVARGYGTVEKIKEK